MSGEVRLIWEGKRPAALIEPAPVLTTVQEPKGAERAARRGTLIHGDNLGAMAALHAEFAGQFALVYLDPPFFTGRQFHPRRNAGTATGALDVDYGNGNPPIRQTPDVQAHQGFSDDWSGDLGSYLQWLYDRVTAVHRLLAADGTLYLHLSWHSAHYAKIILDEIFGPERFQNEIAWCYREAINSKRRWNRKHDTLLFYSKGEQFTFNSDAVLEPYSESTVKKFRSRDERGPYRLMGRGITDSPLRSKRDLPPELESLFPDLTYRHYLGEGTLPVDYWYIDIENQASKRRTGYPTQKPEALLERIILASSNKGDLVGDFCCGSGTTLAVADRLGRRWVGCDANPHAVAVTRERLHGAGAQFAEPHLTAGLPSAGCRDGASP